MNFCSALALRVYRRVHHGVDHPLGYTLDGPVPVPSDIRWYVRHNDTAMRDDYSAVLFDEVVATKCPGLSLAGCRGLSARALDGLRALVHLETLDLFHTETGALQALADHQHLSSLNLTGTAITDRTLGEMAPLPALAYLDLSWTEITDEALVHLQRLPALRSLRLRGTAITDRGLASLADLSNLVDLDVQETAIGDAGVASWLGKRPLSRLNLAYTHITDASVPVLATFTNLRALTLRATRVRREHAAGLRHALGQLGRVGSGADGEDEGLIF